jgi:hypothetical protein
MAHPRAGAGTGSRPAQAPDPGRVAALAKHLAAKGIHESLAKQVATDILIMHPAGGTIQVRDGVVTVL